jgi:UDP-2,3-diacylglucosamine pyrophosphatase LpxH
MSYGKMTTPIDIISTAPTKDAEGFVTHGDNIVASVRAYKEVKNSTEKWANMAQFATANTLFRFRKIPALDVVPSFIMACADGRYKILSVEDVRGRGMYVEVVAEKVEGSS